jgi:hypothetical protein
MALAPAAGYVAAVAVEGHGWHLACWEWPDESITKTKCELTNGPEVS